MGVYIAVKDKLYPDTSLLQRNQTLAQEAESLPVLREEFEEAVRNLKSGKSPGVDSIPFELLKNGGEATATVPTVICQKFWETKERPKECSSYLYQRKAT